MGEQLVLTGWLKDNFDDRTYRLRLEESRGDCSGDSLHDTSLIFAFAKLHKKIIPHEPNLLIDDFCGDQLLDVLFYKEMVKFFDNNRVIRSWVKKPKPEGCVENWWCSWETITPDQEQAFIIACIVYDAFTSYCSGLFWRLIRRFGFYENTRKVRTLEQKSIWRLELPDILRPDSLALYSRASEARFVSILSTLSWWTLPLNALFSARSRKREDHMKLIAILIQTSMVDRYWSARVASWIFVNFRVNNSETDSWFMGHQVLDVVRQYYRPSRGHADAVYWLVAPVITKWIKTYARQ